MFHKEENFFSTSERYLIFRGTRFWLIRIMFAECLGNLTLTQSLNSDPGISK